MKNKHGRAIVLGASITGLYAGRMLSDFYDEVIILDKEPLDKFNVPRKAVPQGNHIHGILTPSFHILKRFLPEVIDDLISGGAHVFDGGRDWSFHIHGNFLAKGATGQLLIGSTRPFFESILRRRVSEIRNIKIWPQHIFSGWISGADKKCIEGVLIKNSQGETELRANLFVDARGRASTLSKELQNLSYESPLNEIVEINMGYTSRLYKAENFNPGWNLLILNPSAPETWMGALIEKVENELWIMTQFGYFGDQAPANDEGFFNSAQSLAISDFAEFLTIAEPVSDYHQFGTRECKMYRFEKMKSFPDHLLVMGDAVCSLNPIYGQGMTKAAREAQHLWESMSDYLQRNDSMEGFSDKFRKSLPFAGAEWAWQLTTGNDLSYPQTKGRRRLGGGFMGWYMKQLFLSSAKNLDARRQLADVLMLVNPPNHLMKPGMVKYALGF